MSSTGFAVWCFKYILLNMVRFFKQYICDWLFIYSYIIQRGALSDVKTMFGMAVDVLKFINS